MINLGSSWKLGNVWYKLDNFLFYSIWCLYFVLGKIFLKFDFDFICLEKYAEQPWHADFVRDGDFLFHLDFGNKDVGP